MDQRTRQVDLIRRFGKIPTDTSFAEVLQKGLPVSETTGLQVRVSTGGAIWQPRRNNRVPRHQLSVGNVSTVSRVHSKDIPKGFPSRRFSLHKDRCFRCGDRGHRAATCRNPVLCFSCNRTGHRASSCPYSRSLQQKRITSTSFPVPFPKSEQRPHPILKQPHTKSIQEPDSCSLPKIYPIYKQPSTLMAEKLV